METTVAIKGDITGKLAELENRLSQQTIKKALVDLAKPLKADMKAAAPHLSGALRRSIGHKTTVDRRRQTTQVSVGLIYRKTNRKGWVAGLMQERGTLYSDPQPFVKPTGERHLPTIESDLQQFIQARLDNL
ncbi:HK97 gp10 family phage protein [Candidatus Sororendozoicomonas aggregata]|uniref:HK97 gp10 family phage protein n=1 Tax=Candidatus Sororendozoicomonas aggregata TaxID=3073239 RepID=UPI002ED3E5EA